MRIYTNSTELLEAVIRDVVKYGREVKSTTVQNLVGVSDDYLMKELQCYSFCLLNPASTLEKSFVKDPEWVKAEIKERISEKGENPGKAWELREPYWKTFLTEEKFCYSYGERITTSPGKLADLLRANPGTRQAITMIWDREVDIDNVGGKKRVPCSMYYNFQIREGKLDIIYHMRSSDIFEHFRNDVTLAYLYQDYIANLLDIPVGNLFMVVDSLHAYKKDWGSLGIF